MDNFLQTCPISPSLLYFFDLFYFLAWSAGKIQNAKFTAQNKP